MFINVGNGSDRDPGVERFCNENHERKWMLARTGKNLLYVVENGCKWRALPKEFGNWHTVYMRMRRWAENGVLFHLFEALQNELKLQVDTSALSLDSSCIKVHHDGTGALKKRKTIHRQNTRRPGTPGCEFALPCGRSCPQKRSLLSRLLLLLIFIQRIIQIYTM